MFKNKLNVDHLQKMYLLEQEDRLKHAHLPYKYQLWGANVHSDIKLDLDDSKLKIKLLECKVRIDMHNNITGKYIIENNIIKAYPILDLLPAWKQSFKKGEVPVCVYDELDTEICNPRYQYSGY